MPEIPLRLSPQYSLVHLLTRSLITSLFKTIHRDFLGFSQQLSFYNSSILIIFRSFEVSSSPTNWNGTINGSYYLDFINSIIVYLTLSRIFIWVCINLVKYRLFSTCHITTLLLSYKLFTTTFLIHKCPSFFLFYNLILMNFSFSKS